MFKLTFNRSVFFASCILLAMAANLAVAQISAEGFYQQCLRFETAGDLLTAQQSCLNAVEANPNLTGASVALARIDLALGKIGNAESRLRDLSSSTTDAEVHLLMADLTLQSKRYGEADSALRKAEQLLRTNANSQQESKLGFLTGQLAEARGHYREALKSYQDASTIDALEPRYRLARAALLFRLGDANAAQTEIKNYQTFTGDTANPDMLSLLGRTLWSQSRLAEASSSLEAAISQRDSRDIRLQTQDLIALALTYYGQGNTAAGNLAFRDALRRGASLLDMLSSIIPWLILLILTVGVHLWGESRITTSESLEEIEHPELWRISHIYSSLFLAALAGIAAMIIFSILRYNNFLAIITPLQSADVRAIFTLVFTALIIVLTVWRVQKNGWDAFEKLFGSVNGAATGILLGIGLLAASFAYLRYFPESIWFGGFYLNFWRLTPLLLAAALLLPLTQVFFSSFVVPALERRYDGLLAVIISGALFALVLAQPLVLVLAMGLITAELFKRTQSGFTSVFAHMVLSLGIVLGVSFLPFLRNLFL